MSSKLTKEHIKMYLVNPDTCPFCGEDTLKAKGAGFVETICSRDIECTSCKETFTEEFVMIGISRNDDVLIVSQDNFLDDVEFIYYEGYANSIE